MKVLLLILAILAGSIAIAAAATPRVVSDPSPDGATHCGVFLDAVPRQEIPVALDSAGRPYCDIDISGVTPGAHVIRATFVRKDSWGVAESVQSSPFEFARPTAPAAPSLRLVL